ncbi:MAG: mannitol-1-phosphate 5-dehydrogenase [Bacteroidota bacterium]|nr:mannitol-1-phosphate 5-dehydrogenase [Bacteroidota bacterium]
MKKLLLFGAGKIGRSFIGPLFGNAGYELVFTDIDQGIVELLNDASSYRVIIRDSNHPEREKECIVENVSALHLSDTEGVINHMVEADMIALSVGKRGLMSLPELLARGLNKRYEVRKADPVDMILAENVRNAARLLREGLEPYMPGVPVEEFVGLVETSIGKMVPIMTEEQIRKDPLSLIAEPYNTLILDRQGFRNEVPDVKELAPKMDMKAWVDRKIFIHNMGHATLAYQTYFLDSEIKYTWEALSNSQLRDVTRKTMLQSAEILMEKHPDVFTLEQLIEHTDDLLKRFSNRALGDTIFRVGCDLSRKLSTNDRLMIPIVSGIKTGKEFSLILEAWVKGCYFNARDAQGKIHPEDKIFKNRYAEDPIAILRDHCKLNRRDHALIFDRVKKISGELI